jgi:hypothetical protein
MRRPRSAAVEEELRLMKTQRDDALLELSSIMEDVNVVSEELVTVPEYDAGPAHGPSFLAPATLVGQTALRWHKQLGTTDKKTYGALVQGVKDIDAQNVAPAPSPLLRPLSPRQALVRSPRNAAASVRLTPRSRLARPSAR